MIYQPSAYIGNNRFVSILHRNFCSFSSFIISLLLLCGDFNSQP